jgi:ketosteroid isomerase-like protein
MSQKNVAVMKTYFEVWNTGDLNALRGLFDPEVIMRPPEGLARAGAVRWSRRTHARVDAYTQHL